MGCTLIRSPPFEDGDARLASVPTDNGTNAFALDGQGERALSSYTQVCVGAGPRHRLAVQPAL